MRELSRQPGPCPLLTPLLLPLGMFEVKGTGKTLGPRVNDLLPAFTYLLPVADFHSPPLRGHVTTVGRSEAMLLSRLHLPRGALAVSVDGPILNCACAVRSHRPWEVEQDLLSISCGIAMS